MASSNTKQRAGVVMSAVVVVALIARGYRSRHQGKASPALPAGPAKVEGRYDIRQGAAGYAPIIGTFGALAVPAIIVLFTVSPPPRSHETPLVVLAAGLLSVAVIASITGAIGLAAIGAEQDATANLVPATMFLAVAVSVSLVAVMGAFEVLAAIYLAGSKTLFAVITGVTGLTGAFFTALGIGDSWHTGPSAPAVKAAWQGTQWINSQLKADRKALLVTWVSSVPAVIGIALRLAGVHFGPSLVGATWLVAVSLALSMVAVGRGVLRARHPVAGPQKGLRDYEAYGTALAIGFYTLTMMIFLP